MKKLRINQIRYYNCFFSKKSIRIVQILLLFILVMVLYGCMGTLRAYYPLRSEVPIKLFNKYEVELCGWEGGVSTFVMSCQVYFLTKVPADSSINEIPILIIDTICFSGYCLDNSVCRRMISWAEEIKRYPEYDHSWQYGEPLPGMDLWVRNGVIIPGGFYLESGPYFANACYGLTLTVEIKARLLDRATQTEIAREIKKVKFEIRRTPAG